MSPAVYQIKSPLKEYLLAEEAGLAALSAAELVAAYNLMSGKDVKRFSDRKAGERRLWAVALNNGPYVAPPPAPELVKNPAQAPVERKAAKPKEKKTRRFTLPLGGQDNIIPPTEPRPNTKRLALLEVLRTTGITFDGAVQLGQSREEYTIYQRIRNINIHHGWRIWTNEEGVIYATKEPLPSRHPAPTKVS